MERTHLIYGNDGSDLLFLEANFARELGRFRVALEHSDTWGELEGLIPDERYRETVDAWMESEAHRLIEEGERVEGFVTVSEPEPDDPFDAEEIEGYVDSEWPEMALGQAMTTWVDKEIISEYGRYIETLSNDSYPVIEAKNEAKVVSLLEKRGYTCTRDDDLIWNCIFWVG